jgi:SIR2-like domain
MTKTSPAAKRRRTIYFFGAGASAAESPVAPTNVELHERIRRSLHERRQLHPTLHRFLARWAKGDYADMPTVEELLSIFDTCLHRGEPIGRDWSITELTQCREELLDFIHEFIGRICEVREDQAPDNGLYQRLLEVMPRQQVTLISLNYDTLLDITMCRLGLRPDYGLDFLYHPGGPAEAQHIKLFKLHGSMNWGYCPSCLTTVYTQERRFDPGQRCPNCDRGLDALIVPPSPLKVPPSPFLSALWKKAEWELSQASEIVFVGYSLSDADANIRYLLFRGFFDYAPRVLVVLDREMPEVMARYRRLFPGGVEFFLGGFEAYLSTCEARAHGAPA